MAELVTPFPFATVDELKDRWPDFPSGREDQAEKLLEDASQFILDTVPAAVNAHMRTRRRVVVSVVKRVMVRDAEDLGVQQKTISTGPFSDTRQLSNPDSDFYLTRQERRSLGEGKQVAYGATIADYSYVSHRPWCNLMLGANYCSCGADLTGGEPLWEP